MATDMNVIVKNDFLSGKSSLTLGVLVGGFWSGKWVYFSLSSSFNPWSPGESFMVQKMGISFPLPILKRNK